MPENVKIVKLCFTSPLHVGEVGIGLEENSLLLHSDTIFNAICNSLAKLYSRETVTKMLENYLSEMPFRISSGFPFINDTLYFPKPMSRADIDPELPQDYLKKLKKTKYLTKPYFEKWIRGERFSKEELDKITGNKTVVLCEDSDEKSDKTQENVNPEANEDVPSKFGSDFLLPKVSVSRQDATSSIFFLGSVHFNKKAGIWFILYCTDENWKEKVLSALRLLQHDGIGGKRTWGYGSFSLQVENFDLDMPASKRRLLLSLFYPKEGEKCLFSERNASWGFSLRGGYAYPYGSSISQQKPQRLFIKEGSIFETEPEGDLIKDKVNFDGLNALYHYGIAYSIPIVVNRGET